MFPRRFLFLVSLGMAGAAPAGEVFTAPLQVSAYHLPFVAVVVNGKETLASIDTGAFHGIEISGRLATQLALKPDDTPGVTANRHEGPAVKLQPARLATFAIGGYRARDVAVSIAEGDIERISRQVGTAFDVILGWGFLSKFYFAVDYAGHELRWSQEPLPKPRAPLVFSLAFDDTQRVPTVMGRIGGRETKLLFDTGAPNCNLDPSLASGEKTGALVSRTLTLGGATLDIRFRVKDLSAIKRPLGCEAVVGNNVLGAGCVDFDPPARMIRFGRPPKG